jgi:hypothetical protein
LATKASGPRSHGLPCLWYVSLTVTDSVDVCVFVPVWVGELPTPWGSVCLSLPSLCCFPLPHADPPLAHQNLATVNTLTFFIRTRRQLGIDDVPPGLSVAIGSWASNPTKVRIGASHLSAGATIGFNWVRVRVPLSSLGLAASGTFSLTDIHIFTEVNWTEEVVVDNMSLQLV